MKQSKKINKISSSEKLDYIRENVCSITEERIRAAIQHVTKKDTVISLLNLFSAMNIPFAEESDILNTESETYNKKYATKINGKFSTEYNTLLFIKAQVYFLYRLINTVSEKPKNYKKKSYISTNTIEYNVSHSLLGTMPYSIPMFDCDSELQKRLFLEIQSFMKYLDKNLELCNKVIREEKYNRENDNIVMCQFEEQIAEIYEYLKTPKNKNVKIEEEFKEILDAPDSPEILKKWYHKLNIHDFTKISRAIQHKRLSFYTKEERKAFGDDVNKIKRFRRVMKYFVNVVGKITGETMVYVQKYTECNSSKNAFRECFSVVYSTMGGNQKIVSEQRYSTAYNTYYYNVDKYLQFQLEMDNYLYKSA
ncbi:MAG: hypothetical protein KBT34_02025 [Prevotella sp.]|nr:hypothetical protein [Candidatus Prevotella equi]